MSNRSNKAPPEYAIIPEVLIFSFATLIAFTKLIELPLLKELLLNH